MWCIGDNAFIKDAYTDRLMTMCVAEVLTIVRRLTGIVELQTRPFWCLTSFAASVSIFLAYKSKKFKKSSFALGREVCNFGWRGHLSRYSLYGVVTEGLSSVWSLDCNSDGGRHAM